MRKPYGISVRCTLCTEDVRAWRNLSPEEVRLLSALGEEVTSVSDWNLAMVTFGTKGAVIPETPECA